MYRNVRDDSDAHRDPEREDLVELRIGSLRQTDGSDSDFFHAILEQLTRKAVGIYRRLRLEIGFCLIVLLAAAVLIRLQIFLDFGIVSALRDRRQCYGPYGIWMSRSCRHAWYVVSREGSKRRSSPLALEVRIHTELGKH